MRLVLPRTSCCRGIFLNSAVNISLSSVRLLILTPFVNEISLVVNIDKTNYVSDPSF
jgi:hypothetical protein